MKPRAVAVAAAGASLLVSECRRRRIGMADLAAFAILYGISAVGAAIDEAKSHWRAMAPKRARETQRGATRAY